MSDHKKTSPSSEPNQRKSDQTALLLLTFLDTTWRIAVPVLLCVAAGIWADLRIGSKPWCTLASLVIGFALAGLLVRKQIIAVQNGSAE